MEIDAITAGNFSVFDRDENECSDWMGRHVKITGDDEKVLLDLFETRVKVIQNNSAKHLVRSRGPQVEVEAGYSKQQGPHVDIKFTWEFGTGKDKDSDSKTEPDRDQNKSSGDVSRDKDSDNRD